MAEYNMRIAQRNELGMVDIYYPQTKATLVIETNERKFISAELLEKLEEAESTLNKGKPGGYAGLTEAGYLEIAEIPPEAKTRRFDAMSDEEMISLDATIGDVVCRIDLNNTFFMLMGPDPQVMNAWLPISSGDGSLVTSVNGQTGNVQINKADVGLGNVANESKEEMFMDPVFTGLVTVPTATLSAPNASAVNVAYLKNNTTKIHTAANFPGTPKKGDVWFRVTEEENNG